MIPNIDYSTLFHLSPLPKWIYEIDNFRILDVNKAAIDHYGYSKEEFQSMTLEDLRPDHEIPKLIAAHEKVEDKFGNIYFGVFTHQKKNGEIIRMDINGHKIDIENKKCIVVICQDVSLKEKQFLELQESEKKLKAASEIAILGYWKLDLSSDEIIWSDKVYEIWEKDKKDFDVTYQTFFNTIHPADRVAFEKEQTEALSGVKPLNFSHRIVLSDGSIKWVHEIGRLNTDKNGKSVSFEGTVQDITYQKRDEQRLKLLESVITHTNDVVLITEAEPFEEPGPKILYVNEAFTKMTGYTSEEVIGKSPRILQGPKSNKEDLARLGKALRNWEPYEITTVNYKKNGETYWVNFTVTPVADETGWYTHWIAIERDVTEVMNKKLQNDLLGKISSAFSEGKDLKTSLNQLCQIITEFGEFSFAEIWLPIVHKHQLKLLSFYERDDTGKNFYQNAKVITELDFGMGLPGKVMEEKKPLLWQVSDPKTAFVRNKAAEIAGIKSIFGLPLIHQNEVVGIMVVGTDENVSKITKNKTILTKLESFVGSEINRKRLEGELARLFEAIPDIICLTDLNGIFLKINKAGCELLGYEEHEILGKALITFVHPADKDITIKELQRLSEGETTFKFENRYISKSGETIWLSWHSNSLVDEGLVFASAKDITKEKKLQELLKDATQMARIGGWEVDLVNNIIVWSEVMHRLHETNPLDYKPNLKLSIDFYREDYQEFVSGVVDHIVKTGEPFDFEAPIITAKGNQLWIRAIGNAEFVKGECIRIYGSFQDINSMKCTELQLKEILGSISDAFYAVDKNWNFTFFNKEAENLLNRKSEDLIDKNFWEVFPSAKGTKLETIYRRVSETEKSESFEYYGPESKSWFEVNAYPSNGGVSSYFKNIDERRSASEALRNSNDEKNKILESIGDAFFTVNKNGIVTYWNAQAEKYLGKKRETIVGKYLWEEYTDAIDSDFFRMYHKAIESNERVRFEEFYPTLNIWFDVSIYPNENGLSIYSKDISLRKKVDLRVKEANERFEKVTKATTDALWDWDIINDSFYRGEEFEKLFGYEVNNQLKQKDFWQDSFHPEDLRLIQKSIQDFLADSSEELWQMEYRIIHKSGDIKTVIDKGVIIRNEAGEPTRMVGAITDISDRKKHEAEIEEVNKRPIEHAQELELSNEQLEQFAYIASHDLQEPLRMITSFLNQL